MNTDIAILIQARISSSRLPGKVLLPLGGDSVLGLMLRRLKGVRHPNRICVATTNEPESTKIGEIAKSQGCTYFQGDLHDVLDRFYQAAAKMGAPVVVRLTADCPLLDPFYVDDAIDKFLKAQVDYASNVLTPCLPDGQSVEVFSFHALERAWNEAKLKSEREHVTPYIWKNSDCKGGRLFRALDLRYSPDWSSYRMTLDYPQDLQVLEALVRSGGTSASLSDYIQILERNPEITRLNSDIKRMEGYRKSLAQD